MYKLLCTDMDGTLLNSQGRISEKNIEAIKLASKKGVKIVICTGRVFTSANFYSNLIGVKTPVIAANGAYIREKDRDEVIYKATLDVENCRKVVEVLKKYNINPHYNTSHIVFTGEIKHSSAVYERFNRDMPKENQIKIELVENWEKTFIEYEGEILKCIAIDDNREKIKKAKEELTKIPELEVVSSLDNNIEVMSKGVSKGRAVEILAGYYNLTREEIICVGDNENDISMIEYAGLGVAMGNGEKEVKEIADFITDTNDNDGVAKVIEKFIL